VIQNTRNHWFVAGVALYVVALLLLRLPQPPPVGREHIARIQNGMSREEVNAIIGCPPADYTTKNIVRHIRGYGTGPGL
jgi:hypothetical protein